MKSIQFKQSLFYYDGVQVFQALDTIGGHYVGVLAPGEGNDSRYLLAGVNPERTRDFRVGKLDLRSLLMESEEDERFIVSFGENSQFLEILEQVAEPLAESELLPEPGFFLHYLTADDDVLREARDRNNIVLELLVESLAAAQHRISATTLAELLVRVQSLARIAHRTVVKDLPTRKRPPWSSDLDVIVPAASGSFRVFLEASENPDLFGESDVGKTLARIDELFACPANVEETLETTRHYRGHLAGAYLKLLQFLTSRQTCLQYSWASPRSQAVSRHAISHVEAESLVGALSRVKDIDRENVQLEGIFQSFNRNTGAWGLLTTEGLHRGKIGESVPSLDGLEVGARYLFDCSEVISETDITGRESRSLVLNSHERL